MNNLYNIEKYNSQKEGNLQRKLYDYYTGNKVPVDSRVAVSDAKADSHTNMHVDFFKDIVELKVGYAGSKIIPVVTEKDDTKRQIIQDEMNKFQRTNMLSTLNSESVRLSTISGKSHRLCYTENGEFKVKNIPGWQVIYEFENTPLNPSKAYYYYEVIDLVGNTSRHCDVYDESMVTYYKTGSSFTSAENSTIATDKSLANNYIKTGNQLHNFKEVPIIPIMNNDLEVSDCDQSISIMNQYDYVISDTVAEIKAMRMAYLIMYGELYTGLDADGNEIDINTWMKQTSIMRFPSGEDGTKVGGAEFLEKNINDAVIENSLNRLRTHIYETSGSLDLKELANTERVFSIKAQMMRLENTAMTSENYMRSSLYKQDRLWVYWMNEFNNLGIDEMNIDWEFTRVFPRDLAADATTISQLANTIGLEDALTKVGWLDAREIAQRVKEENDLGLGDEDDTTPDIE